MKTSVDESKIVHKKSKRRKKRWWYK